MGSRPGFALQSQLQDQQSQFQQNMASQNPHTQAAALPAATHTYTMPAPSNAPSFPLSDCSYAPLHQSNSDTLEIAPSRICHTDMGHDWALNDHAGNGWHCGPGDDMYDWRSTDYTGRTWCSDPGDMLTDWTASPTDSFPVHSLVR